MRVFVFGVLLARTLNAQVADGSDGTVTALDEPAPLITPGADALAESDLVGANTDATLDDSGAATVGGDDATTTDDADLPTGTADVIVEETLTDAGTSEEPTTTDDASGAFGDGEDAGAGVEFNGSEFDFPTASDAGDVPEETTTTDSFLPEETETTTFGDESTAVGPLGEQATPTDDLAADDESTAVGELGEQATPTDDFGLDAGATATVDAGGDAESTADPFGNLAPEDDLSGSAAESTPIDDFGADSPEATPANDGFTDDTGTDGLLDEIPTETPVPEPAVGGEPTGIDEGVDAFADATPAPESEGTDFSDSGDLTDAAGDDGGIVIPEDASATPVFDEGVSSSEVTDDPSLVAPEDAGNETAALPEQTDPAVLEDPGTIADPGTVEEPALEPTESSSTIDLGPTPLADPLAAPEIAPGVGGALSGGVGAAYADDDSPGTWTGEDVGNYDGQDVGDEECPASCYEEDEDDSYGTSSTSSADDEEGDEEDADEDDEDYEDDSLVKKVVRWISRRALGGSNGGFAAFSWPIDQKDKTASYDPDATQDCEDIPEWLYESSGKKPDSCPAPKAKCPAKCYEYGTGPKPYPTSSVPGGYETKTPDASTSPTGYSQDNSATDVYSPYPDFSTTGYYEITTQSTQTTFVTSTTTVPGGYQDSGAQADYTGDTLASICPKTCDPFNPAANKCDITSSCTTTGKGKYYCACRAGYRASAWNAKDFSKQFKFPDQPYVYTAEGVVCDKVCSDQTCTEVLSRPQCQ